MILPTKHIPPKRALLTVGGEILMELVRPKTVSILWDAVRDQQTLDDHGRIGYDWFILALDLLFLIKAVEYKNGTLRRAKQ